MRDGTGLVLRRIEMDLDKWDELDRPGREIAVGRSITTGAPLTGRHERDEPDFGATDKRGLPVIPAFAHIRRARLGGDRTIYRRGYSYDDGRGGGHGSSGLLFASYQADVTAQFLPIQRSLAELDILDQWTTPIGSAVFAIPPGCAQSGFIGEGLFR